jgi:hypothetical protein
LQNRGIASFRGGAWQAAIADASAALAQQPQSAPALYLRGVAKLKNGDSAGGNADMAAATAINARIAGTYAALGVRP